MKAADVRRVIEHAIPSEVGLTCDYAQTGNSYHVRAIKVETTGDAIADETMLSHALTAEMLHYIADARRELNVDGAPPARLFWHTPPTFVPATPKTEAAIRVRYVVTNLPKLYETADEVTAALEFWGIEGRMSDFERSQKHKGAVIGIKPSHKGLLHKDLGVPQGKPIPAAKLAAAKNSPDPAVRKRATFAQNAKGWNK